MYWGGEWYGKFFIAKFIYIHFSISYIEEIEHVEKNKKISKKSIYKKYSRIYKKKYLKYFNISNVALIE